MDSQPTTSAWNTLAYLNANFSDASSDEWRQFNLRSFPTTSLGPLPTAEGQRAPPEAEGTERDGDRTVVAALPLPPEYNATGPGRSSEPQPQFCRDRFSTKFLEGFRDRRAGYSQKGVVFDVKQQKFTFDCQIRELSDQEKALGAAPFEDLQSYQYLTGPKYILKEHCLNEIMAILSTMDVLRATPDPESGGTAVFSPEDLPRTEIVIIDEFPDGPYFDLFQLASGKEPMRLAEWVASRSSDISPRKDAAIMLVDKLIIPLAGAANPLWSDWVTINCDENSVLRVFVQRVFGFYGIPRERQRGAPRSHASSLFLSPSPPRLNVSIVVRRNSRRLIGLEEHLFEAARVKFAHVADIRLVDFEGKPFREQIEIPRDTDVLLYFVAGVNKVLGNCYPGLGGDLEQMPDDGTSFLPFDTSRCWGFTTDPEGWSFVCSDPKVTGGEKSYRMCKNRAASDDWYHTCEKKEASDIWWMTRYIMEQDRFLKLVGDAIEAVKKREMEREG
ncbi:hypothetical protein LA080_007980 [Diaporthe eres]|nr:hypothetical protein LA080_007980 [Diaporthe eres]